jgi:pimeloyl-ACP methyl ester carboxylesterase
VSLTKGVQGARHDTAPDTARRTGGPQPSATTVGVQGRAATPVVLVHGFAGSSTSWSAARRALRADGWTVVLFGYPPWASSVDDLAARLVETVEDVLAATGAGKVHLVGHSLGGVIIAPALTRDGLAGHVDLVATLDTARGSHHARRGRRRARRSLRRLTS